jgi:fatty acid-binding protein DegV
MERTRTDNGAFQKLISLVEELGMLEQLAFVHTHALEKLERLKKEADYLVPQGIVPMVGEVTPVIGAHIGPGAVGFSVIKAA